MPDHLELFLPIVRPAKAPYRHATPGHEKHLPQFAPICLDREADRCAGLPDRLDEQDVVLEWP